MSILVNKYEDKSLIEGDIKKIVTDNRLFALECELNCMFDASLWLYELNVSLNCNLKNVDYPKAPFGENDYELYMKGMMLFRRQNYTACAKLTEDIETDRGTYMHCIARFKSLEANKPLDSPTSCITKADYFEQLKLIEKKLDEHLSRSIHYGFSYYLRGLICLEFSKKDEASGYFQSAANLMPQFWNAWEELINLTDSKEQLLQLNLPHHWMKEFFLVKIYMKLHKYEIALSLLLELQDRGFKNLPFIVTNIAVCFQQLQDVTNSLTYFRKIFKKDPFVRENMDNYSNILYVLERFTEIEILAHSMFDANRHCAETCAVLGNYYSMRGDHNTAQDLFSDALLMKPSNVSYWILRGHEFVELKTVDRAIECYRNAVSLNPRDFRAWFGLAAAYEIAQVPFQAMYYYNKARSINPLDGRPVAAIGEIYERRGNFSSAIRCYNSAKNMGHTDELAITRLAKLYSELNLDDKAAETYEELIKKAHELNYKIDPEAYKFLARYYFARNDSKRAFEYCTKCLQHDVAKKDGKIVLRELIAREYANNVNSAEK